MGKTSKNENFSICGPTHLTSIDWNNFDHRTSITSSLIQGVYTLEQDRQRNRPIHQSQAATWWEHFHFTLTQTLLDQTDHSIYGAVFEYKHYSNYQNTLHLTQPPHHVIAFRGTIIEPHPVLSDLKVNILCIFYKLHQEPRFDHTIQTIEKLVMKDRNVWLAGHSLGAGLALLAGKTMARRGFALETYIFNPPNYSVPSEQLFDSEKLKYMVRMVVSLCKAGIAMANKDRHNTSKAEEEDSLMKLASWKPYLYVNPSDPICSEYIGYFKNKTNMFDLGLGKIENYASRNSIRSQIFKGKESSSSSSLSSSSSEPIHFLPSAYMTLNTKKLADFMSDHGIHQWWDPQFNCNPVLYEFKP